MTNINYKKVYICHPYADDPDGNIEKVLQIVKDITSENKEAHTKTKEREGSVAQDMIDTLVGPLNLTVPVAVHLLFPKFMSEETFGREIAMDFCLEVLKGCEEIWVYGPVLSAGMRQEVTFAGEHGIRIVWKSFE